MSNTHAHALTLRAATNGLVWFQLKPSTLIKTIVLFAVTDALDLAIALTPLSRGRLPEKRRQRAHSGATATTKQSRAASRDHRSSRHRDGDARWTSFKRLITRHRIVSADHDGRNCVIAPRTAASDARLLTGDSKIVEVSFGCNKASHRRLRGARAFEHRRQKTSCLVTGPSAADRETGRPRAIHQSGTARSKNIPSYRPRNIDPFM
ncbi:hypothetical protein EVAR_98367_1 [Eumeta japonica]|uniref:Uncharacterized protein n=1 Tax=Eumeta variegata TaxID=151549 RepID=A0A4C2A6Y2_EUMVA|nr:hypothetical protein EVAR_98367_1 [Eumeta japonica]